MILLIIIECWIYGLIIVALREMFVEYSMNNVAKWMTMVVFYGFFVIKLPMIRIAVEFKQSLPILWHDWLIDFFPFANLVINEFI